MDTYKSCIKSAEVKTTYSIRFASDVIRHIIADYRQALVLDTSEFYLNTDAFKCEDKDGDMTSEWFRNHCDTEVFNALTGLFSRFHGGTWDYIAKKLGFDGYSCAGHYDKDTGEFRMTVFKYGDALN